MARSQIRIIVQALERVATKAVKKIVLDATANLIEDTPVDTGWAMANWVPAIAGTFDDVAGQPDALDQGPQQAGIASVAADYRLEQGYVTVTNNVPYIQALNAGSSKQAPTGFVQAAILRAVQGAGQ